MNIDDLKRMVQDIVADSLRLSTHHTSRQRAPVNYACIFTHSTTEYEEMAKTLYVLGAGSSVCARGPLVSEFKEKLRSRLPTGSPVLSDLLQEPDAMPADRAAILIPHYLGKLERELKEETATPGLPVLRA